jgi:hypothetical protein
MRGIVVCIDQIAFAKHQACSICTKAVLADLTIYAGSAA